MIIVLSSLENLSKDELYATLKQHSILDFEIISIDIISTRFNIPKEKIENFLEVNKIKVNTPLFTIKKP